MQLAAGAVGGFWRDQRAAVARALEEVQAGDHGIASQAVHVEAQRPLHEAVQDQLVRGRIDVRDAAVVALEVQAGWGQGAFQLLQRRARSTAAVGTGL